MNSIYDITCQRITGEDQPLSLYKDTVLLIVNTASQCGFTPQFQGLEALYKQYHSQGFEVLGFPCNQFGSQDPGKDEEIHQFCQTNYGVSFPMFAKIEVNGPNTHTLYEHLKSMPQDSWGQKPLNGTLPNFLWINQVTSKTALLPRPSRKILLL